MKLLPICLGCMSLPWALLSTKIHRKVVKRHCSTVAWEFRVTSLLLVL